MQNTLGFIADIKAKHGVESDYAVAKILNVTGTAISSYRNGKSFFSDEIALRVADLLDLDPAYVVACIHAEREKNLEVKKMWSKLAERMSVAAVFLVFMSAPLLLSGQVNTGVSADSPVAIYIHYAKYDTGYLVIFSLLIIALIFAFPFHNSHKKR